MYKSYGHFWQVIQNDCYHTGKREDALCSSSLEGSYAPYHPKSKPLESSLRIQKNVEKLSRISEICIVRNHGFDYNMIIRMTLRIWGQSQ